MNKKQLTNNNMKTNSSQHIFRNLIIVGTFFLTLFWGRDVGAATYYLTTAGAGSAQTPGSWNTGGTGGGGAAAVNFTTNNDIFIIASSISATFGANTIFGNSGGSGANVTLQIDGTVTFNSGVNLLVTNKTAAPSAVIINSTAILLFNATSATQLSIGSGSGGSTASTTFTFNSGATVKTVNTNGLSGTNCSFDVYLGSSNQIALAFGTGGNFEFSGVAQTLTGIPATVNNLTLSGTGAKTIPVGTTTVNGILSIENGSNVNIFTGALALGTNATLQYNTTAARTASNEWVTPFASTGGVIIANTGVITINEAKSFNTSVPLTINSGSNMSMSTFSLTLNGNLINNGTLSGTTGGVTISGNSTQSIGAFTTTGPVSMTKTAGTATFTGNVNGADLILNGAGGTLNLGTALTHTFSGDWTRTAGTINGGSSLLKIAGSVSGTGGTFTASTGTVEWNAAGIQTVAPVVYNNLTLSGGGTKTMTGVSSILNNFNMSGTATATAAAALTIGGNFTLGSGTTFTAGSFTHYVSGNWTNNGATFNPAGSTISLSGGSNPIINGTSPTTFNNINLSNSVGCTLSQSITITGTLTFYAGKLTIGANTLTINGNVSGMEGTSKYFTSSPSSNLIIGGATTGTILFDPANNTIKDLTLNTNATTTLGNTLKIAAGLSPGTVIVNSGATLTTGGNLILKSDANGTARVGNSAGTISGNLTVERYVPATARKFRLLASPVVGATSADWRNNGINTSGIGIQITGNGGASNHFDPTYTNSPSAYEYNEILAGGVGQGFGNDPGWQPFIDGNTTQLSNGKGFRVMVRGDRNTDLWAVPNPAPTPTTISVTGSYPSADVDIQTTKTGSNANSGYNLVGNPFPSSIDWDLITKGADISNAYYIYSPSANVYGTYSLGSGGTSGASKFISSSQGFLVLQTGVNGGLTVSEGHKSADAGGKLFKTSFVNHLLIAMKYDDNNSDEIIIHFRPDATNGLDKFDGPKLINSSINIASMGTDGKGYNINCLPTLSEDREIPLSILGSVAANYSIIINDVSTFKDFDVYLVDNYKNITMKVNDGFTYPIEITSDSATIKDGRFKVVFQKSSTGTEELLSANSNNFVLFPNPASQNINLTLVTTKKGEYAYSILNQIGQEISHGKLDFAGKSKHAINIEDLSSGVYFVKVFNGDSSQTIRFIK